MWFSCSTASRRASLSRMSATRCFSSCRDSSNAFSTRLRLVMLRETPMTAVTCPSSSRRGIRRVFGQISSEPKWYTPSVLKASLVSNTWAMFSLCLQPFREETTPPAACPQCRRNRVAAPPPHWRLRRGSCPPDRRYRSCPWWIRPAFGSVPHSPEVPPRPALVVNVGYAAKNRKGYCRPGPSSACPAGMPTVAAVGRPPQPFYPLGKAFRQAPASRMRSRTRSTSSGCNAVIQPKPTAYS